MTDALPFVVPSTAKKPSPVKRTEAELLAMLRKRHTAAGNGGSGEYAVMLHVRNDAAFRATRTFDAVTMALWPSRGLTLHAYEVKSSRSDWLRELKQPEKAEAAAQLVDRFSVVAGDDSIVADGELPEPWGLLVARGNKLVQVKAALQLPGSDATRPVSRGFLVCLLRAVGAVPPVEEAAIRAARDDGYRRGVEATKQQAELSADTIRGLRLKIQTFEQAAGISIEGWNAGTSTTAAEVGATVRAVLAGEKRAALAQRRLADVRQQLLDAAAGLDQFISTESSEG